jgi:SagB-type dehydrogenase family enzyme
MRKYFLLCLIVAFWLPGVVAQNSAATAPPAPNLVALPAPNVSGGMPLTQSLATRRTVRTFSPTPLTKAELSQILWAAQGITGPEERRTAPSAGNQHYVRVYVASAEGFFQYLSNGHQLQKISGEDLRSKLSSQPAFSQAPVVLLLAGDYERAAVRYPGEKAPRFIAIEAGHIAQNVLLQVTALGLAAVPVGGFEPKDVQKAASLPTQQMPVYMIPFGHPK